MENPYLPYAAPQGIPDPDFHSAMHPVQNTVPEFDNIFDHAVTVWKANLWMLIAATLITFLVIPFGFNIASATVQGLVNSVENPILAMIFGVILTTVAIVLNVFLGVGSTKFSIQVLRGGPANLGVLFQGGNRLLPVLGLLILWGIEPIGAVFVCSFLANINPVFCAVVGLTFCIFFVVLGVTFVWVRLGIRDSVYGTKSRIQCMVQKVELRGNEQFCMTRHCWHWSEDCELNNHQSTFGKG